MNSITIRKPLYSNFCYIRDRVLFEAIRNGNQLKVIVPNGSAIIDPQEWIRTGKKMEKVFKIKNRPMQLWGNYLPINENQDAML
jgi:hypothetical protein